MQILQHLKPYWHLSSQSTPSGVWAIWLVTVPTPANHQFMEDINPDRLIEWARSIGPQTTALVKATLQSRSFPQQAYRSCLGILSLAKKYSHPLLEQACKAVFEAKEFSYKAVLQELVHLQKLSTIPSTIETLPTHENIRGAEYYQERQLS
ncbi:MAG: transposase IS21 family protein [Chloroflexi bacterium]|nr:MAG: transposase IS21 family protein [Chloroflexota bacterium]